MASHTASHTMGPGPVITSSMTILPMPTAPHTSSGVVPSNVPTGSAAPSGSAPATPSTTKPSSATHLQKKIGFTFALMVFLPAVINAL
ncbi:hypothetical protein FBU30_009150 [Linnemannia zychae]|nr:hypothetical protein FBU30_009150 [Linnemannia zychae]